MKILEIYISHMLIYRFLLTETEKPTKIEKKSQSQNLI